MYDIQKKKYFNWLFRLTFFSKSKIEEKKQKELSEKEKEKNASRYNSHHSHWNECNDISNWYKSFSSNELLILDYIKNLTFKKRRSKITDQVWRERVIFSKKELHSVSEQWWDKRKRQNHRTIWRRRKRTNIN